MYSEGPQIQVAAKLGLHVQVQVHLIPYLQTEFHMNIYLKAILAHTNPLHASCAPLLSYCRHKLVPCQTL